MAFFFTKLLRYVIFFYAIYAGSLWVLRNKSYHFSPKEFRSLAEKAKGEGASAVVRFASDLRRSFGPLVTNDLQWTGLQAGGLQLKALVLHGGFTEFVVALHAPFATVGRTGFHFANTSCSVLSGGVQRVADLTHSDNAESFAPGTNFRLTQFESSLVALKEKTYVVCYGRGLTPFSGLWALPQNVLGGDFVSFGRFIYLYGKSYLETLSISATQTFDYVKKTYLKTEL